MPRSELSDQYSTNASPNGVPGFYLANNQIIPVPAQSVGVIRLWFYQRPNNLVVQSAASQISAIVGTTVTVGVVPTTFTTGTTVDFIKDQPFFECRAIDQSIVSATTTTITFSTLPTSLVVGDWVALAGQTPVPQIPVEFRPLLVQRCVVKYYEIQGYLDKMAAAQKKLEEMEKDLFAIINPRVREEPKIITASTDLIGGTLRFRAWTAS
jgi:hypothetical protein